ncbi:MAG: 50S ribosomal protein L6 [Rickettsiaceae bacterium H1]|nr:50S ribosomal protein L6 [Rickettsiaceae bacterium H1]
MSRIGNLPICIPADLKVKIDKQKISVVKGDMLENFVLPEGVNFTLEDNKLFCKGSCENSLLGLFRSKINNLISGVHENFQVMLEVKGVGYKVSLFDRYLTLFLGFSHAVKYRIPSYLAVKLDKPTEIFIFGRNKDKVNMIADDICNIRKYDPYKKKGISKKDNYVYTKEMSKK